jgi:hypothetical protein
MKKELLFILAFLVVLILPVNGQDKKGIKVGMTSEQNLQALTNPSLYSTTTGFDERYQGVKGSPRLLDTLLPSTVLLRDGLGYYEVNTDIDVVRNTMLFILPASGDLLEVASSLIEELTYHTGAGDMLYRTTEGLRFDRELKGTRFCQVLSESPHLFIKIPDRKFLEANYTGLYSPDKRYDEYVPDDKYFIMGSDSVLYRVQLSRKSLSKLFPSQAKMINSNFSEKSGVDPEQEVIRLLKMF